MCLCDSRIVCGPFVQACDVRQCCCDRLFGSACVTLRLCVCYWVLPVTLRCYDHVSVTRCLWLLVSLKWYLVVFFWLSDWMTVKKSKVLWKVILGCVCPPARVLVCAWVMCMFSIGLDFQTRWSDCVVLAVIVTGCETGNVIDEVICMFHSLWPCSSLADWIQR